MFAFKKSLSSLMGLSKLFSSLLSIGEALYIRLPHPAIQNPIPRNRVLVMSSYLEGAEGLKTTLQ